jgi:hypothetical protein
MKKYVWATAVAVLGALLAGVRSHWRIGEILSGALWGAVLGFVVGLAAELEADAKGGK